MACGHLIGAICGAHGFTGINVIPYGDEATMAAVARRYGASYLVIEAAGAAGPIKSVYDRQADHYFTFLTDIDGTRIFRLGP